MIAESTSGVFRRLLSAFVLALLVLACLAVVGHDPAIAEPGGGGCNVFTQTCGVGVGGGGHGGGGGGDIRGGVTAPGCHNTDPTGNGCDPCNTLTKGIPADRGACQIYSQNLVCSELNPAGMDYATWESFVQSVNCAANAYTPGSPAVAAENAYRSIHFPKPTGDRSPSQDQRYRGYPFTYVGLWTWFWTDAGTWRTLTATATDGDQSATVTASPVALVYDPGDGNGSQTCDGPGRAWTSDDGNAAPSDGGCAYQYHQVTTSPIASTQSIIWKITWVGTGNTAGEIPQLTTSTTGQLNVMQIQTVVTR